MRIKSPACVRYILVVVLVRLGEVVKWTGKKAIEKSNTRAGLDRAGSSFRLTFSSHDGNFFPIMSQG
jgi:hypothetical protein